MVGQFLPKPLEPEVQQILCMTLTVRLAYKALHAVVNQFLCFRENMTLDEDVRLENNAHRCILDPVCLCVCLVLYHIVCIHKEIDTNEVTDNIIRKRETKRRRVYVYVCVRAWAHTHAHTNTHSRHIHTIHTYMSNLSLHTYHCLCLSL
jgi:hypothetical protein